MTACIILVLNWHFCPWIRQCSGQWRRGRVCSWQDEAESSMHVPAMPPVVRGQGCLKGSDCWCRRLFQSQPRRWWGQECAPPTFPPDIPAARPLLRLPARPPVRAGLLPPAGLIHRFSGRVCADRGQGPQRKMRKGSGEWMDRWNCPSISFRD